MAGGNPVRICTGLGLLTFLAHVSGSGAVTYMLLIPAMIPVFDGLGMKRTTMTTIIGLSAGLQNTQPWGATAQRCMAAFQIGIHELWIPLLIPLGIGMICIIGIDYFLGWQEKNQDFQTIQVRPVCHTDEISSYADYERPGKVYVNSFLVFCTVAILVSGYMPSAAVFLIAFSVALLINYPDSKDPEIYYSIVMPKMR